jgi:hypothetical protein
MEIKEVVIKTDDIKILAKEGEKFIFKPKAEEKLIELLMLKEFIDSTLEEVKEKIAEAGLSINPNFKGVIGDKVRCTYRPYGAKYKYDWKKKEAAEPFLKRKEYWSVDGKLVDKYVEEVGELPDAIEESDRENKLSFILRDEEEERQLLE